MALIGLFSLSLCNPISTAAHSGQTDNYVTQLQKQLDQYTQADSALAASIQQVQIRMPIYQQWILQGHECSRQWCYRLDVITQCHDGVNLSPNQDLQMHYSQWRVRQLLDSLHYHLVGVEGADLERLT